jgi:hypothetical protein
MRRSIGRKYQELQFSAYTLPAKDGSQLFQTSCSCRSNAGDGHLHCLSNHFIAGVPSVEIQHFHELSTSARQLIHGFTHVLLLLGLNPNLFCGVTRVGWLIEFIICAIFAMFLGPDVNALPCSCCDQPRTHLGVILKLTKVFNQPQTDGLKNIGTVRSRKTEPYRNGINKSAVTQNQHFPGLGIPLQTQRYNLGVTKTLVFVGAHLAKVPGFPK